MWAKMSKESRAGIQGTLGVVPGSRVLGHTTPHRHEDP